MTEKEFKKWYPLSEKEYNPNTITVDATLVAKELADNEIYGLMDTRHGDYTDEYKKILSAMWESKYKYYLETLTKHRHI
jgi:hypothetical protein